MKKTSLSFLTHLYKILFNNQLARNTPSSIGQLPSLNQLYDPLSCNLLLFSS